MDMNLIAKLIELDTKFAVIDGALTFTYQVDVGGVATVHAIITVSGDLTAAYIKGGNPFSPAASAAFLKAFKAVCMHALARESFTAEV